MRQELIDLYLGELPEDKARALEARVREDAALSREYAEVAALFSFMARAEPVAPDPRTRERVFREVERLCRPSLGEWLRDVAGLVRFRFRTSLAFRVAALSLAVHLVAMGVLFRVYLPQRQAETATITAVVNENPRLVRPARGFVVRLEARRGPKVPRLLRYGVEGQAEAIRAGLDALLARQAEDGSFGSPETTAHAALALLAEGDCSTASTRRGRAIRAAVRRLLYDPEARGGAVLAALVEDFALSFDDLDAYDRERYNARIHALIRDVAAHPVLDPFDREGLALAQLAGFDRAVDLAPDRRLGRRLVEAREPAGTPTRLAVTAALARGHGVADADAVRDWAAPLFRRSVQELRAGRVSGLALLNLQAPYRL